MYQDTPNNQPLSLANTSTVEATTKDKINKCRYTESHGKQERRGTLKKRGQGRGGGDEEVMARGSDKLVSAQIQPGISSRCPGDNFNNSRRAACPSATTAGPATGTPASRAGVGAAVGRAGPRHMPGSPPARNLEMTLMTFVLRVNKSVSLVAQSCLTLCDPINRSTPGLLVHHQLLELAHTHVH